MLIENRADYGTLIGQIWTFGKAGDCLPWHTHDFEDQHISIVAKGELTMEVRGEEPRTIVAGDLIESGPGVCHQFTALTADARMFCFCTQAEACRAAIAAGKYD